MLSNVNERIDTVRKLYYGVWESVFLYAAPIWVSPLSIEKNKKILISAQPAACPYISRPGSGGRSTRLRSALAKIYLGRFMI